MSGEPTERDVEALAQIMHDAHVAARTPGIRTHGDAAAWLRARARGDA